jgi:diphthine-ammonia ligase
MRMNVGDINDVCDNFMVRATQGTGVELMRPLWGIERDRLKEELARQGYDIVVSCANIDKLGSLISNESVGKSYYDVYDKIKQIDGIDRAGEAGEFHTMVLNAPAFTKRLQFTGCRRTDETGQHVYLNFDDIKLVDKL